MEQKTEASQAVDERALFEAWCVRKGYSTNKWHGDGSSYVDGHTLSGWEAWNARAALKAQPAPTEAAQGEYSFSKPKGWINLANPGQSWEQWTKAQGIPTTRGWKISAQGEDSARLAHGHREDYYLLASARALAMEPIHRIKSMPNWVLARELFATGSSSANKICIDAGIDPDGYSVARASAETGGVKP